jgi:N-acetyl sugar amidotransferase
MKHCSKCLLPETHETIKFDKKGTCNICSNHSFKQKNINWVKKKKELNSLISRYKGKYDYDCIVPFSGGKDSTWTLYYLVKEFGLKPLVVRFDHGFYRPNLEENVKKVSRNLGVDILTFTPNWKVVQKLMLQSLLEKGDFCWHCHTGIFSYPMWIAIEKKIPLIFWGEPSAEYTAYYGYDEKENVDETRFNRYINLGINADDMFLKLRGNVDIRDLKPYSYPPIKLLKELKYNSVCLGSFIKWDVKKQSKIISDELGWKGDDVENVPEKYNYEKIECYMQGVRDYLKFIKRGYSRPSHLVSLDLRNKRISKKEANNLIKNYEGKRPPSLDVFLELVGITEAEFMQIALSHQVSPFKGKFKNVKKGKKTNDYSKWSKSGSMERSYSKEQFNRFKYLLND